MYIDAERMLIRDFTPDDETMETCEPALIIHGIPAVLYGSSSENLFLYIHGKMGCKEEAAGLAEIPTAFGETLSRKYLTYAAEHWFHTDEQLAVLDAWLRKELYCAGKKTTLDSPIMAGITI